MFDIDIKRECEGCKYLFLPNLRWATDTPTYILKMHEHLKKRLGKVGMMLHGWDDTDTEKFADLKKEWDKLGKPVLIVGNARLFLKAKEEFPEDKVASYWEILADYGLPPAPHTHSNHFKPSVIFDPWYFHDNSSIKMYIREIIMMCNYEEDENLTLKYVDCDNQEEYKKTFVNEIKELKKPIITYCNNARDFLAEQGIPVIHVLDMIFSNTDKKTQTHMPYDELEQSRNIEIVKAELSANKHA